MENYEISVLMAVYNEERYLGESIVSVLNQNYSDFEFIIINDGSTDRSLDVIKSFSDKRIKLINNLSNLGLVKSLNIGLKQATGQYIARMDADDIALPSRLGEQINFIKKNPSFALVGSWVELINYNNKTIGIKKLPSRPDLIEYELILGNPFAHPTIFFKKDIVVNVGGYQENFYCAEDYQLYLKIIKKNRITNLPKVLLKYRIHQTSTTNNPKKRAIMLENASRAVYENYNLHLSFDNFKFYYGALNEKTDSFKNLKLALKIHRQVFKIYKKINRFKSDEDKDLLLLYWKKKILIIRIYIKNILPSFYDFFLRVVRKINLMINWISE